jgi:lysophospholipase L1-like esterase
MAGGLMLLVTTLTLCLLISECALRRWYPVDSRQPHPGRSSPWQSRVHRRSDVPGLAYELNPNVKIRARAAGTLVVTNSYGMRDAEPRPPSPSLLRIAVLGDSFTFGFGTRGRAVYTEVLERLLNASPLGGKRVFDVLNFGVGGYSTWDEARVLEYRVRPWHPSAVLIGYVFNDPEDEPRQPLHSFFHEPAWWEHLRLLRLAARGWRELQVRRLGDGNPFLYLHRNPRTWANVQQAFARVRELSEEDGFRVIVAVFPIIPPESWGGYRLREVHTQVAQEARRNGFAVIDLLPAWISIAPRKLRVSSEDGHPNALAHRLAARALYKAIASNPGRLLGASWPAR